MARGGPVGEAAPGRRPPPDLAPRRPGRLGPGRETRAPRRGAGQEAVVTLDEYVAWAATSR
jgi:hypothetical protein